MRKKLPVVAPVVVMALVFGTLAIRLPAAIAQRADAYAMFDPVVDVQHLIDRHFYRDLNEDDLRDMQLGAINGMIEVLGDRYTEYIPAESIADFDKSIRGEYAGIGAEVTSEDGWLKIITPMDDSPAFAAGIEPNDLVVAVDGASTYGKTTDEVIDMLLGPPGTDVRLTIERDATIAAPPESLAPGVPGELDDAPGPAEGAARFDLDVTRARIVASTVKGVHRNGENWSFWVDQPGKIGYVRITSFTGGTIPELEAACRELVDGGMEGMILDLRFNRGGSLYAAVRMADLFLEEGVIVETRGRDGDSEKNYARRDRTLPDFPMVVLINESSASASEIVAGALQDNGRAVVMGTRSFGKGVVQALYRLPSGAGQLKITEQYYYLPSGRLLHRTDDSTEWGVDPTDGMYVPLEDDEYREIFRVRRAEDIIRRTGDDEEARANWADPEWVLEKLDDRHITLSVEAIRDKLATNEWPRVSDEERASDAIQMAELEREERRMELLQRELRRSERRVAALASAETGSLPVDQDLLPGESDLTGGKVQVFDAEGKPIANLSITGPDLEAWLDGAPLAPSEDGEDSGDEDNGGS